MDTSLFDLSEKYSDATKLEMLCGWEC